MSTLTSYLYSGTLDSQSNSNMRNDHHNKACKSQCHTHLLVVSSFICANVRRPLETSIASNNDDDTPLRVNFICFSASS